jgi:hypothetical protein
MCKLLDDFECVEPKLMEKLGSVPPESLDREMRGQLTAHLDICHACREKQRFEEVVTDLMATGNFTGTVSRRRNLGGRRQVRSWHYSLAATLALAAGLLLAVILGPSGSTIPGLSEVSSPLRAPAGSFHIVRPLEREVLLTSGGMLEWTPAPGASSYHVQVFGTDGSYRWSERTGETRIDLPDSGPGVGQYLAVIKPLPGDLSPEGERSVYFRRAGWGSMLLYRAIHLPFISLLLIMVGLTAAILAVVRRPV